jgi:hypothetical protein
MWRTERNPENDPAIEIMINAHPCRLEISCKNILRIHYLLEYRKYRELFVTTNSRLFVNDSRELLLSVVRDGQLILLRSSPIQANGER